MRANFLLQRKSVKHDQQQLKAALIATWSVSSDVAQ